MARFKLIVEYDGTDFVGWQAQDNGLSVQKVLEDAIFGYCQQRVRLTAAGRTDAGVHALGQVAHFDIDQVAEAREVREALNFHVRPHAVSVVEAERVSDDFSARFDATARHYLYRIVNRRAPLALERGRAWHVPRPLDADAMHGAAQRLVGRHDFTTFRAARCQSNSPLKTLGRLDIERVGDEIHIVAEARSFLHHQVRSMVGTLKLVGEGKWSADDVSAALAARDRSALGLNAPARGLYLVRVIY
ncbi:MAG: tRNA pseudouridine(38-40) synthase TruA [Sphingomonadales bacterium]